MDLPSQLESEAVTKDKEYIAESIDRLGHVRLDSVRRFRKGTAEDLSVCLEREDIET